MSDLHVSRVRGAVQVLLSSGAHPYDAFMRTVMTEAAHGDPKMMVSPPSARYSGERRYIMSNFTQALVERRDELRRRLEADRTFQELQLVQNLLDRQEAPKIDRPQVGVVTETGVKAVQDAAETYLKEKGDRAGSSEIHHELVRLGILTDDAAGKARVTSYLGRDKKRFDNIKGRGYGLRVK